MVITHALELEAGGASRTKEPTGGHTDARIRPAGIAETGLRWRSLATRVNVPVDTQRVHRQDDAPRSPVVTATRIGDGQAVASWRGESPGFGAKQGRSATKGDGMPGLWARACHASRSHPRDAGLEAPTCRLRAHELRHTFEHRQTWSLG